MICKLRDISINNRGYYGIGASAINFDSDKYTYLRITDINDNGSLNKKSLMSVDDIHANKYILQKNDIVFARTGASTGRNYFYDGEIEKLVYAGFLIKFSLNDKLVNPRYIKYYCLSKKYNDWILSTITGSTRPNINEKQLSEMPIYLPDREIQNKVVKIMDVLNNKIKLNTEINDNLQELLNETFINWFCKFEYPTENNKPYKSSGGEMINSILGIIPRQWKICDFKDIIDFSNGYAFKSNQLLDQEEKDTYKVFKQGNIKLTGGINTEKAKSWVYKEQTKGLEKFILKKGDILMCMTDMKNSTSPLLGHTALMNVDDEYIVNQRVGLIRCKKDITDYPYVYTMSNLEYFLKDIRSRANSGVQVNLSTNGICETKIILPDKIILDKFNTFAKPLYEKIFNNQRENQVLEQLRDTLLPKLMNGEIDLENIEI